ncbi:contractile injection system protein, VgrG/Pvc8 family [Defluviitalea phaphyphila]|uniref:contractile injection system protein, VgrG/Pvc8 family n=1 Tax=Defluviitalea phaphyphila TaxID=1473580 RepID=UPI000730530B|nr:contractile injection system protein, VgrG/Pvc8 family [Defluviitalea phaphyphila]
MDNQKETLTEVTYEHIKVTPFELVNLEELIITKEINDHGRLYFTGKVPEEVKDEYINLATFGKVVQVVQNKDGKTKILFSGIIKDISIQAEGELYQLTVNAITHTFLMDIKIKKRSFQDINMTYSALVKNIVSEYSSGGVLFKCEDKPLGKFVIQYKETDWEFIKRMASRFNQGLFPSFSHTSPKFFFGPPKLNNNVVLDEYVFSVKKDLGNYKYLSSNYISDISNLDFVEYDIETYKQLELGEEVIYKQLKFFVKNAKMYFKDGVLRNNYKICTLKGLKQRYFENPHLQGVSIMGQVLDIQRDRVKVHMYEIDEKQDINKAYWFPYSAMYASEDGSGWYCMPEKGDDVRIEFPNTNEENAFAVSSISKYNPKVSDPKEDRMGDYQVRYIRNPQGMEISLTPSQVIISANGKGTIIMDEKGNISIYANKKLSLKSDKEITISAEDSINVKASNKINLSCADKAEIILNKDGVAEIKGEEVFTN